MLNRFPVGRNDPAVRQQVAGVLEHNDAIAQQAPPLVWVGGYNMGGLAVPAPSWPADPSGASRFAAARQLADAGITVMGTVHLGSLQDGDGAAGDTLDEAAVLALADEIELVDAPPSALADRVKRGEIAPAGGAEHALQTDYSPGTLGAKREQAFTIVAEHAERRLAGYRGSGAPAGSDTHPRILGCAAPRPGMEPLIRRSAALAAQLAGDFLVTVVTPEPASADLNQVLAGYAALASQLGGQLTALQGSPADTLAEFAHRHQVTEILLARDPGAQPAPPPERTHPPGRGR